jgi:hypothetical protein
MEIPTDQYFLKYFLQAVRSSCDPLTALTINILSKKHLQMPKTGKQGASPLSVSDI